MKVILCFNDVEIPIDVITWEHVGNTITIEGLIEDTAGLIEAITRTRGRVYFDIGNYRLFAVVAEYAVNMIAAMETGFSDLTISMNIRDIEKLEGVKV